MKIGDNACIHGRVHIRMRLQKQQLYTYTSPLTIAYSTKCMNANPGSNIYTRIHICTYASNCKDSINCIMNLSLTTVAKSFRGEFNTGSASTVYSIILEQTQINFMVVCAVVYSLIRSVVYSFICSIVCLFSSCFIHSFVCLSLC